jgi:hypothetical protein
MTSSGVTYPSAVPSANGQTIIGNTDGTTSWGWALPSGTNGDILYYNSGWQVLAKGTAGHYLKQGSSIPEWAAAPGSKWTQGVFGINYQSGNVGIGGIATATNKLFVSDNSQNITVSIGNQNGTALTCITHGSNSYAVHGLSSTRTGIGVAGASDYGKGVQGIGLTYGGYFKGEGSAGIDGIGVHGEGSTCGGYFKGGVIIYTGALTFGSTEVISETRIANFASLKIGGTERISSAGVFTPSNGVSGTLDNTKTATVVNGIITAIV